MKVCADCFTSEFWEEIKVINSGDESLSMCPTCRQIEGETLDVIEQEDGSFKKDEK